MSIQVTSTTDTPEAVTAAQGNLKESAEVKETKSASDEKSDESENVEASEASEDETEESDESDSKEEKAPKKSGFKRRIDKLTAKVSAAEQEREYWRQEALKHQKPDAPKESQPESKAKDLSGKPSSDDFETHEAYVEALTDWKLEVREREREEKTKQAQVKTEFEKQLSSHLERVESFKSSHDDFDEVLEDVNDVPMSIAVQDAILKSDNGPELMYELAKNKEEYARICALPALDAARALGKFEARLAKENQETKPVKTTKAPPPIKTVGSKASSASTKSPDEMDFQDYKRWREKHPNG